MVKRKEGNEGRKVSVITRFVDELVALWISYIYWYWYQSNIIE